MNQPAFPTTQYVNGLSPTGHDNGMTLRDYFAAKAMQGLLANGWCAEQMEIAPSMGEREVALDAYRLAEAMIKAREV